MSATATATPAAPAPAWLAAPAGDWKTLSAAMTAEVPAIAGRPVPVACAPGAGLGAPACYLRDIPVIEVGYDGSDWPHHDGLKWPHCLVAFCYGMVVSA